MEILITLLSIATGALGATVFFLITHKEAKPLEVFEETDEEKKRLKEIEGHYEALLNYDMSQVYKGE